MKKHIMALLLILGAANGFAQEPMESIAGSPIDSQRAKVLIDEDILDQKGVEFFNALAKHSQLYSFLLSLERGVPEIAKQLKYLALLNEAHLTNQTLSHLLIALNHNNQLLETFINKGERLDG